MTIKQRRKGLIYKKKKNRCPSHSNYDCKVTAPCCQYIFPSHAFHCKYTKFRAWTHKFKLVPLLSPKTRKNIGEKQPVRAINQALYI